MIWSNMQHLRIIFNRSLFNVEVVYQLDEFLKQNLLRSCKPFFPLLEEIGKIFQLIQQCKQFYRSNYMLIAGFIFISRKHFFEARRKFLKSGMIQPEKICMQNIEER